MRTGLNWPTPVTLRFRTSIDRFSSFSPCLRFFPHVNLVCLRPSFLSFMRIRFRYHRAWKPFELNWNVSLCRLLSIFK